MMEEWLLWLGRRGQVFHSMLECHQNSFVNKLFYTNKSLFSKGPVFVCEFTWK